MEYTRSTMRPSVCILIFVLASALAKPSPAVKPSVEDAKLESEEEDLKIEDTGMDKDRAKKSASFIVDIKPTGSLQMVQAPCKDGQQAVQSSNIVVQSEPVAQSVQSYNMVQPSYVQPSYVQPSYIQPSYIQPSSVQYIQLVQSPSKPCTKPVPLVPQTETVPQASVEKQNSNSEPVEAPKEQLKPERIELAPEPLPVPQETLTILPAAPSCHEHSYALPSSSVMYPELEPVQLASLLQGSSTPFTAHQCPCQNNMFTFKEAAMEPTAVKALPYSLPVAGSPVVMPYNARMHIVTHDHGLGSRPRHSHSHIHAHVDMNAAKPQSFIAVPASQYSTRGLLDISSTSGISVNSYPSTYRAVSPIVAGSLWKAENDNNSPLSFEVNDLTQSNKMTREVDSSAKMEEVKQEADDNGKSTKEEAEQN